MLYILKCKRDNDREIEPEFNLDFGPPPTLHGHKSPPTEDFIPLLFHNQICSQRAYITTSRFIRRISQ